MKVTCFSVLEVVVESEASRYGLEIDSDKMEETKKLCEIVDWMSDQFDGISYNVMANLRNDDGIVIELECDEVILEDKESRFYDLLKKSKGVTFKHGNEEESLIISVAIPGVWVKDE